MLMDVAIMMAVQAALWGFYAILPCMAICKGTRNVPWPLLLGISVLLGITVQAGMGFLWGGFLRYPAWMQGGTYIVFWIAVGIGIRMRRHPFWTGDRDSGITGLESVFLVFVLGLAFVIRLAHPLHTWALGQSDAYTHLAMFRDLIGEGILRNTSYPPGYPWIMAMPSSLLGLDAYYMARFGGAFWGVALILGVYIVVKEGCRNSRAALISAWLISSFPGFMLLHKTGVGCFANQAGLFILPMALTGATWSVDSGQRFKGLVVLGCSIGAMLMAVPMMLLHMSLVAALFWLCWGANPLLWMPNRWRWPSVLVAGAVLAALAWVILEQESRVAVTTTVLITSDETAAANMDIRNPDARLANSIDLLMRDYFSIKRMGFGRLDLDLAFGCLLLAFVLLAWAGKRRHCPGWMLIGCWGILATVQTGLGFMQFTAYQREGWSFLVAVGCLGGILLSWLWSCRTPFKWAIGIGLLVSAAWTVIHPPAHNLTTSTAEDSLVRIARMVGRYPDLPSNQNPDMERFRLFLYENWDATQPVSIMIRPLMQEWMLSAVSAPNDRVVFSKSDIWRHYDEWFNIRPQTIALIDHKQEVNIEQLGKYAAVSVDGARSFQEQQNRSYTWNGTLEEYIKRLTETHWKISYHRVNPNLTAYYVALKSEGGLVGKINPSGDHQQRGAE